MTLIDRMYQAAIDHAAVLVAAVLTPLAVALAVIGLHL